MDYLVAGFDNNLIRAGYAGAGAESEARDSLNVSEILTSGSITSQEIGSLAVDATKLAALSVEAEKLANSSVTATKIANLAVGTAAIALVAIGTAQIANGAITDAQIGSLNADKIVAGTITGRTLQTNGGATGINTRISASSLGLDMLFNNSLVGYLTANTSSQVALKAYVLLSLASNGGILNSFNEDGGTDYVGWASNYVSKMLLESNGDLTTVGKMITNDKFKCGGDTGVTEDIAYITNPYGVAKGRNLYVRGGIIVGKSAEYTI